MFSGSSDGFAGVVSFENAISHTVLKSMANAMALLNSEFVKASFSGIFR